MLKMGQMCHCGATVIKWNSDGERQWRVARGLPPRPTDVRGDWSLFGDYSNNYLWAYGQLVSASNIGVNYRYGDIDTLSPNVDWKSNSGNPSAQTAPYNRRRVYPASDGHIWSGSNSNIQRLNSSGALQNSINHTSYGFLEGPSGDMFSQNVFSIVERLNTSLVVTNSYFPPIFGTINDVVVYDASHLCVVGQLTVGSGPWKKIAILDHTLAETATFFKSGNNQRGHRLAIAGNSAYVAETVFGVPQLAKYDLTGITETWVNTTMQASGSGYSVAANGGNSLITTDESGDVYVVSEKFGAVSKIQKRSTADGSITWETDIGTSGLEFMRGLRVHGGILVAIGRWYQSASSTDPRHIIALDPSDGSVLWTDQHGDVTNSAKGLFDLDIDDNGNVYACGVYA